MGLKEQLMQDYKDAMKNADAVKKNTVNMVRAASMKLTRESLSKMTRISLR